MASTFSNLKFELIGTGDQSGTWGTTTNTNLGTAIEQALVGMATISSGFVANSLTLTLTDTNAAQNARALVLNLTQALSGAGTLNVPAIQKPYMIINATGQTVTVKVTGLTGVAVPTGTRAFLYNNGTDVGDFFNYASSLTLGTALPITSGGTGTTSTTFVNLTTNVTGTLPIANGGTGTTSTTFVNLATNVTGTLPIANGGTGTTSTTFVNLATNVTGTLPVANGGTGGATQAAARTGIGATTVGSNFFTLTNPSAITFPRMNADNTVSALDAATFRTAIGAGTGAGTVTSVSGTGTVQGLSLSGTVTGSGNITLGGSLSAVSLTTQVSGTLPVGNGGTGAATFTANNVLLGNGTSAFQTVAPGTAGNVLTSNGTTWASSTPAGGALTNNTRQAVTSSATTTINLNSGNVIDLTMAASISTLSFTNVPASGTPILVQIVIKNASSGIVYGIVWPSSIYWSGQYAASTVATVQATPVLASGANGVTVIALLTTDGGTKWRGWVEASIPGGSFGALYSWGQSSYGVLGQTDMIDKSSPVQVGALTNWSQTAIGKGHVIAVKNDGTLWSWGRNPFGQLGQGNTTYRSSPVQVGSLTGWASVGAGGYMGAAIKTDGSLWTWGFNIFGQLGQGNVLYCSSPIQVGSLTNWALITGSSTSCAAVKNDGTLWSWGSGSTGQLGQNSNVSRSSPVQVGSLTNWRQVFLGYKAFCAAVKTDGTLWMWGQNNQGYLGQNTTINQSSPVQVGSLTDWASAAVGYNHCAAVKTDGTLWSWGGNSAGQLGQGNTTYRSSPVQVGALTNWAEIEAGVRFSAAIKTDGTLWSWGSGTQGKLGQGNLTYQSSPVQVGALTTWGALSLFSNTVMARTATTVNPA